MTNKIITLKTLVGTSVTVSLNGNIVTVSRGRAALDIDLFTDTPYARIWDALRAHDVEPRDIVVALAAVVAAWRGLPEQDAYTAFARGWENRAFGHAAEVGLRAAGAARQAQEWLCRRGWKARLQIIDERRALAA